MQRALGLLGAIAVAAGIVACGSEDASDPSHNDADITQEGFPVGPDGKPLATKLDGQYELNTIIDLTDAPVIPDPISDSLKALSNFKEHPAQTIVDLMDAANVPAANILNAIPGPLRPSVLGFIDDYVFKALFEKVPVTKKLAGLLDDVGTIATHFELVTHLDLPSGDANGKAKATHAFFGVGYSWDSKRHVIEVPENIRAKVGAAQTIDAAAAPLSTRSKDVELGRLQLGDHTFGIPLGTFAVKAIDQLTTDHFGADLRGSLGKVIDCNKLGDAVANNCIDPLGPGKICVGHKDEITKICTTGLDLLVKAVQSTLTGLDVGLHMNVGTAQMWDSVVKDGPLDAVADRIELGFWSGGFKANNNESPFLSTFTGHRIGGGAVITPATSSPK